MNITPEDVQEMLNINPLANEQVQKFALERENAELRVQIAAQNGKTAEKVPEPVAKGK